MIKVKIVGKFDLGYLLKLEDSRDGQLRVTEMQKGKCLDLHMKGCEDQIYGETIEAYIVTEFEKGVLLSQFTKSERDIRDHKTKQRRIAGESCRISEKYDVEIIEELDWGFIFQEIDGFLEHALLKENLSSPLMIGDKVAVEVTKIDEDKHPIFHLVN